MSDKHFKAGDVVVLRNGTIVDDLVDNHTDDIYTLYSPSTFGGTSWTKHGEYLAQFENEFDIVDYASQVNLEYYSTNWIKKKILCPEDGFRIEMPLSGGSSDYYKIPEGVKTLSELVEKKNIQFPYNILFLHLFRSINGMLISDCKEFKDVVRKAETATRDYKHPLFDHDYFNITKAIYRFGNKDGVSTEYDLNKIKFFLDDLLKHNYDPILAAIRKEL